MREKKQKYEVHEYGINLQFEEKLERYNICTHVDVIHPRELILPIGRNEEDVVKRTCCCCSSQLGKTCNIISEMSLLLKQL